jgi:pimeloyl-ACP methyl ester carboxylesterase
MFEYQFTELPNHGYRCIGIDLRGFGDSDKPWNEYRMNTTMTQWQMMLRLSLILSI